MITNPKDVTEQVANLNERLATVASDHLGRIKNIQYNQEKLAVANRQILEIFTTLRIDSAPINGAYDCDGKEFSADDFSGDSNPYDLLVAGKAPTVTYTKYSEIVSASGDGNCGYFGLDTTNRKFKVPTITRFLEPGWKDGSGNVVVGKDVEAGLPEIEGNLNNMYCVSNSSAVNTGAFVSSHQWSSDPNYVNGTAPNWNITSNGGELFITPEFKASKHNSIYGNSTTVQPNSIKVRVMVQLSNVKPELSIKNYQDELTEYTKSLDLQGRHVGEIITSILPISYGGLHLLDGTKIYKNGIYQSFIEYMETVYEEYPSCFVTEEVYEASITASGKCGKFVYTDEYIRLPTIYGILEGTEDEAKLGDKVDAGLPNISGTLKGNTFNNGGTMAAIYWYSSGCFKSSVVDHDVNIATYSSGEGYKYASQIALDASQSNSIYGNSTTVQPPTIKVFYYIVLANSTKTDIEVDIDNITTELDNKLNKSGGDITGKTTIAATDLIVTSTAVNGAGVHNSIFRGKYLGSSITEVQSAAIRAGTFDDLYIGDYWIINNVKYVIAAFDYYLHTGDTECTAHHIVVVPEKALYQAQMNGSNTTEGAYVGSAMYKTNLNSAKSTILAAFGSSHLLSIRQYFQNATANNIPTGGIWTDATVFLMSEMNVYGCRIYGAIINGTNWPTIYTTDNRQYPYFAMNNLLQTRDDFWLRDVCSAAVFAAVTSDGNAGYNAASNSLGVRPAFCVI